MIPVSRILKDYADAGSLDAHVPVQTTYDQRTLVTKSGGLMTVLEASAVDPDCLDPTQLDHVARSFERAVRIFDTDFRIYQYLVKLKGLVTAGARDEESRATRPVARRAKYFDERSDHHYTLAIAIVILYEGWKEGRADGPKTKGSWSDALRCKLSGEASIEALDNGLDRASRVLADKVDTFIGQLQDVLPLAVQDSHQSFQFLRRLLNYAPHKAQSRPLKYPAFIGRQAADSALECHRDHLRLDDYYVQVLSLKEPPSRTFAHLLRELPAVRGNLIVATEWQPEDNGRMRRLIQSKRRHFHNSKTSLASQVTANPQASSKDVLTDHSAVALVDELGQCLEAMEIGGCHFGRFSMTLVLYDLDRDAVQQSVVACSKVFAAHDAAVIEERYNLANAWLAVLPGNGHYNLRRLWLSSANYAHLSFLFAPSEGHARNAHLMTESLAVFETESGVPFHFNLHCSDVAHTLVLGSTGSGKSFLLNFLVSSLQKYEPYTFIFDLGRSYDSLTSYFGGSYTAIGTEGATFGINPFSLAPTAENQHFLVSFCRVLVESAGYVMTSADERDLIEQVSNVYALGTDQHRLLTLANIVNRPMRLELAKWVQAGPHARWFDNTEDSVTLARFQTFDLEGLAGYPQVLEPLLFYILHRANDAIYAPTLAGTFKVFVLDEAWRFFRHPAVRLYVTEALKTWRKRNAAMVLATQSLDDLRQSELLSVAVESCPTKLLLANPGMDRSLYRDVLQLNATETDRIASLVPKKQVLIKQPAIAKVVDLNVDPFGYWLYTTDIAARRERDSAFAQYGPDQGLEILAASRSGPRPERAAAAPRRNP